KHCDAQRPVRLAPTLEGIELATSALRQNQKTHTVFVDGMRCILFSAIHPPFLGEAYPPRVVAYLTGRQGAQILTRGPCTAGAETQSRVRNLDRRRRPAPRSWGSEMCQAHIYYDQWSSQSTFI